MLNDFGSLGRAYCETVDGRSDLESVISDLISGQYDNPVRVVAFNTTERWSEDASEDIAREIMRRPGLAGDELPSSLEAFVDQHLGPDRQLTACVGPTRTRAVRHKAGRIARDRSPVAGVDCPLPSLVRVISALR